MIEKILDIGLNIRNNCNVFGISLGRSRANVCI